MPDTTCAAVVLSIDRSGSMAMATEDERVTELELAREAAHLVVDLLDERDEVRVQSWDTEFIWDVALGCAKHVIFLSIGPMTRSDFQGLLRRMVKDKPRWRRDPRGRRSAFLAEL